MDNKTQLQQVSGKVDILSLNLQELSEYIETCKEKKFRAKQIYQWLHQKLVTNFDEMLNIPAPLRNTLKKETLLTSLQAVRVQVSDLDGTTKYLFQLFDGNLIESVLMKYKYGNSVCISSQVGCRMGCSFCASTVGGLERNLLPSEMLGQIYRIQALTGERVDNVVVMGSGEPMDNFDNLLKFMQLLNDENGLNISARSITVSTCGLVPKIRELADLKLQITLAISLHAPNDELRRSLMPVANRYSVAEILEACSYYIDKTGRRVSFEYSLIAGVNDTDQCAVQLIQMLKGMNCHVNLIPVNPIKETQFTQSAGSQINYFKNKLEKSGIHVTIRREMGRDIDGACGQLRKSYIDESILRKEQI